ncbi:MAG: glycosyltransferase [Nitrospinae bacterium]|nr:glycosyltransferase [Nitrospinota bacterium]
MNILTFNWHTPYLSLLARLPHTFDVAPPNIKSDRVTAWDRAMRPLPPNVTPITTEEMLRRLLEPGRYDLLLAHNVKDLFMSRDISAPKLVVFHNRLSTEAALGKQGGEVVLGYRQQVRELTSGVYRVFISETKRADWDMEGGIIPPGVDVADYGGYQGDTAAVLRVGNSIRPRDLMTGFSLQQQVCEGLPNVVMGENPDIPGSRVSEGWEGLKAAFRAHRLLLNTAMPPWEDGYNLAVLEAMATGMPVVSVANPTSPFTDGADGLIGADAETLRRHCQSLLEDQARAVEIGARGRATVSAKFPMGAFLEKWDRAISEAVDQFASRRRARAARVFAPLPSGRRRVLLSYTNYPAAPGAYLERVFRRGHEVVTAGCPLTPEIKKLWNLNALREEPRPHDIVTPDLTAEFPFVRDRLPKGFTPDFLLWVDTGLGRAPEGVEHADFPTAAYFIDTHLHLQKHLAMAEAFDVVFLAQRAYIPEFAKRGMKRVHWLPLACDPDIHGKRDMPKEHDIGFVGSLTGARRVDLLMKLAEHVDVRYGRLFLRDMADFFCRSRIVFNNAIKNDLNMRVFEALCSGSLLLTDAADGLTDFFEDRTHLVIYTDDTIADLAAYYLDHPDELAAIAEAGRAEALARHTYAHRAERILASLSNL